MSDESDQSIIVIESDHNEKTHTNEKPFKCEQCDKSYRGRWSLTTHIRTTHSEGGLYQCEQCDKAFKERWYLRNHVNIVHTDEKPLECEHCDETFKNRLLLNQHMRTHPDENSFQCELCSEAFKSSAVRKTHMATHTNKYPFKCEQCDKRFKQKYTLNRHMSTHTDKKPYKCKHCGKGFKHNFVRKQHMHTHKDEKLFECDHCDEVFKTTWDRLYHMNMSLKCKEYRKRLKSEMDKQGPVKIHNSENNNFNNNSDSASSLIGEPSKNTECEFPSVPHDYNILNSNAPNFQDSLVINKNGIGCDKKDELMESNNVHLSDTNGFTNLEIINDNNSNNNSDIGELIKNTEYEFPSVPHDYDILNSNALNFQNSLVINKNGIGCDKKDKLMKSNNVHLSDTDGFTNLEIINDDNFNNNSDIGELIKNTEYEFPSVPHDYDILNSNALNFQDLLVINKNGIGCDKKDELMKSNNIHLSDADGFTNLEIINDNNFNNNSDSSTSLIGEPIKNTECEFPSVPHDYNILNNNALNFQDLLVINKDGIGCDKDELMESNNVHLSDTEGFTNLEIINDNFNNKSDSAISLICELLKNTEYEFPSVPHNYDILNSNAPNFQHSLVINKDGIGCDKKNELMESNNVHLTDTDGFTNLEIINNNYVNTNSDSATSLMGEPIKNTECEFPSMPQNYHILNSNAVNFQDSLVINEDGIGCDKDELMKSYNVHLLDSDGFTDVEILNDNYVNNNSDSATSLMGEPIKNTECEFPSMPHNYHISNSNAANFQNSLLINEDRIGCDKKNELMESNNVHLSDSDGFTDVEIINDDSDINTDGDGANNSIVEQFKTPENGVSSMHHNSCNNSLPSFQDLLASINMGLAATGRTN